MRSVTLANGVLRLKYRTDRRYGLPVEPWAVFHLKLAAETWRKLKIYGRLSWQSWRIGRKAYELADIRASEPPERQPRNRFGARKIRERVADRVTDILPVVPEGDDHHRATLGQSARKAPEEMERFLVRPLEIVHDGEQRLRRAQSQEQLGRGVLQPVTLSFGIACLGRR